VTWLGNVFFAGDGGERGYLPESGARVADPLGSRGADGLWRPGAASPVLGSAALLPAPLATDLDGQPREGPVDVGADQRSEVPVTRRPLTAKDVGPQWRRP
jgi:poly(beta-D-mannuronate) lyase